MSNRHPIIIRLYSAASGWSTPQLAPDEIHMRGDLVSRGHITVRLPPTERRLFLVLAVRQGRITPMDEIVEALWGDDASGGPDGADRVVDVAMVALRDAGAALGYVLKNYHGRGYELRPAAATADLKEMEHV